MTQGAANVFAVEEYAVHEEPYYLPIGDEVQLFATILPAPAAAAEHP